MTMRCATEEEAREARERIIAEWLAKYDEWFYDLKTMDDLEYGYKYGYKKSETLNGVKDSLKAVLYFQKYIFTGRWMRAWEKHGYKRDVIWQLELDGFLSANTYRSGEAYRTGKTEWAFISQKTAKEIWKNR